MTKIDYLKELSESKKSFIIYKSDKGFDLYTDFSKKIILTNNNIKSFINKTTQFKSKKKETDLFIGFFGYEVLNNLIGVKVKKQKGLKFLGSYLAYENVCRVYHLRMFQPRPHQSNNLTLD